MHALARLPDWRTSKQASWAGARSPMPRARSPQRAAASAAVRARRPHRHSVMAAAASHIRTLACSHPCILNPARSRPCSQRLPTARGTLELWHTGAQSLPRRIRRPSGLLPPSRLSVGASSGNVAGLRHVESYGLKSTGMLQRAATRPAPFASLMQDCRLSFCVALGGEGASAHTAPRARGTALVITNNVYSSRCG